MDFHLSCSWLKEFVSIKESSEKIAELFQLHGASVERVRRVGDHLQHIVLGQVKKIEKHPNADRLQLVDVEIGDGTVGVVCGAQNVKLNMKVALALPGAKIKWHGEGDWVTLEPAKVRGIISRGMICAASEIGLADAFREEDGIMDFSSHGDPPGTPLAHVLKLNDDILDVEVTTNRPDMMCVVGLAREASAITDSKFLWKEPKVRTVKKPVRSLKVTLEANELCPRYTGIVLENVTVGPSPRWLTTRLEVAGIRSINNVVDITNYVLLELGQPLHVFDADTLKTKQHDAADKAIPHILVRRARANETILALDGKLYQLTKDMLVIADEERPIAIAGVMGGEETGVKNTTTTVVVESATFNPVSLRRTARALNLSSGSSQLFEKGLPAYQAQVGLWRAVELLQELTDARVASIMADAHGKQTAHQSPVAFDGDRARRVLGMDVPDVKMKSLLQRLGIKQVRGLRGGRTFSVPWWRGDITIAEDLTEEVARLVGYHNFSSQLPDGQLIMPPPTQEPHRRAVREYLLGAGVNEIITYSFISQDLMQKSGLSAQESVAVENPLSDEFTHLRTSLVPGALKTIGGHERYTTNGAVFEIGRIFVLQEEGELPREEERLCIAMWSDDLTEKSFRTIKGIYEGIACALGIEQVIIEPNIMTLFHPGRTGQVVLRGERIGWIGQIHPDIVNAHGLHHPVYACDINLESLLKYASDKQFNPLPNYPSVKRDVAFVIDNTVPYASVATVIMRTGSLIRSVELFDIFRGGAIPQGKCSLAIHIEYRADDKTLTDQEVEVVHQQVIQQLRKKFSADIRE